MGNCNGAAVWPRHNQHLPPPFQPRNPAHTTTTADLLAATATEPVAAAMAAAPTNTMMGSGALRPWACCGVQWHGAADTWTPGHLQYALVNCTI